MNTKRKLIHDTHAVTNEIIDESAKGAKLNWEGGSSVNLSHDEYTVLHAKFIRLMKTIRKGGGFNYNGYEYDFVPKECRVMFEEHTDLGNVRAELCFKRIVDSVEKQIHVTYSLYKHNHGGYRLSFVGNPTTVLNGNNITPVRIDSVSHMQETLTFYRIGFLLLEQILGVQFNDNTRKLITRGQFKISNTQWAMHLLSKNKAFDLSLIGGLYAGALIKKGGFVKLGEHLGFQNVDTLRGKKGNLSGVFLIKKNGANHVLSINFYDKLESVKNKKQGQTLSAVEQELVDNTLRLDITAHHQYLQSIVRKARRHAEQLVKINPALGKKLKAFFKLSTNKRDDKGREIPLEVTAYLICRSMSVLAMEIIEDKAVNVGFTKWLTKAILEDELRLMSILKFNPDTLNFNSSDKSTQAIIEHWRNYSGDADSFQESVYPIFQTKSKVKQPTKESQARNFRNYQKKIAAEHNVDISIPYIYCVEYGLLSATYGLSDEERAQYLEAITNKTMRSVDIGNTIKKLAKIRDRKFEEDKQTLLNSLQLVARQIEATPANIKKLWSWVNATKHDFEIRKQ